MKIDKVAFSRQEISWIIYDVGNSAFVLVLVTTIMPIYFKDVLATSLSPTESTAMWAYANAIAAAIVAIFAPVIGTYSDFQSTRKPVFSVLLLTGLLFTCLLATVQQGDWLMALLYFVIARCSWAGANIVYDSFLLEVTSTERIDKVSAHGYGWGYIGSVIPFLVIIGLIFSAMSDAGSNILPIQETQWSLYIVTAWWLLFSLPLLKYVHQKTLHLQARESG